jgi:hypothetical protein
MKDGLPQEVIANLHKIAAAAFSNRAGTRENVSDDKSILIFEGNEDFYGCLNLGIFDLEEDKYFMAYVKAWEWLEDDPDECCDMIELFSVPVR